MTRTSNWLAADEATLISSKFGVRQKCLPEKLDCRDKRPCQVRAALPTAAAQVWRNFQHGHKPFTFVIVTVRMRPAVSAFCFRVSRQIENLNVTIPKRFTAKHFFNRHRFTPSRAAIVQLHYRDLDASYVIFIRHSVQSVRQPSNDSFPRQPPLRASCGLLGAFSQSCNKRNSTKPQLESSQISCCMRSSNESGGGSASAKCDSAFQCAML